MSTDLQRWLDGIEVPAGFETDLVAGVRRRRRARSVRTAAAVLATTACLAGALAVAPWQRLGGPFELGTTGPATGEECSAARLRDPSGTANGFRLEVSAPATAPEGSPFVTTVVLRNTGDRPLRWERFTMATQLCVVARDGTERAVRAGAGDVMNDAGGSATLEPGSGQSSAFTWNLRRCGLWEDPDRDECTPDGLPAGSYRVYGWIRARSDGQLVNLAAAPATVLVEPAVTG